MMRKSLILLLSLAAAAGLQAQSLDAFKQRLSTPVPSQVAFGMAKVSVGEYGDAADAVRKASRQESRLRFKGYRVCVFFDNGQNARADAKAAVTLFEEKFPGIRTYLFYENPYFKVTVGNCVTTEEAIILMERVKGVFPKSFLKSEELSVNDLAE